MSEVTDGNRQDRDGGLSRGELLRGAVAGGSALFFAPLIGACDSDDDGPRPREVKYGGKLRVAFVGGGTSETLDPNAEVSVIDAARAFNLFDQLIRIEPDVSVALELAQDFEPNATADEWTIRLRRGVKWHDGSPLTADDLIYTFNYVGAPDYGGLVKNTADLVDLRRMRKLDNLTVRLPLKEPNSEFLTYFAFFSPIKDGTTDFKKPIGTGPFTLKSFTPGQGSVFEKNRNYWREGKPFVDELRMVSIPESSARLNALLGGQVDAIERLDFSQAREHKEGGQIRVLEAKGSNMVPIYMAIDLEPFNDVRVRQAMRLIADRKALVDVAQLGLGEVGNDMYGKGLPFYNDELPQREQDIEQAKSLLKAAGREDLRVTLHSSTAAPGMLESATAFAEQARDAGVRIDVDNGPADQYYGEKYLKLNFAQTQWFTEPIWGHISKALGRGRKETETHWGPSNFFKVYREILREVDAQKRQPLYNELQEILWNEGGYLIWGFSPQLDGVASNVNGLLPNAAQPLGRFDFKSVWLS